MYFRICREDEVENIKLNGKESILIRIGCYNDIRTKNLYKEILYLDIKDVVFFEYVTIDFEMNLIDNFIKLNNFILENNFDEVIVHCALSISRSPAIMICISKILGCKKIEDFVKEGFSCYSKVIVSYFEQFDYIKKKCDIGDVIFYNTYRKKLKVEDDFFVETISNNDEYDLILKKKRY